jgi:hypothetical protein
VNARQYCYVLRALAISSVIENNTQKANFIFVVSIPLSVRMEQGDSHQKDLDEK